MDDSLKAGVGKLLKLKGQCYKSVLNDNELSQLSFRQVDYMKQLNQEGGVTTSQIAEMLQLSKPTVTEMVKKFVKMGYVEKCHCPNDKRVYYARLTEKGQIIADLDQLSTDHLVNQLTGKLDQEDIQALAAILNKIG